jgi:hypothetical protein
MSCIFEHEVSKTTANYEWTGPKISREVWNEILSFFKWTYDETKSESQVRLFVNHVTKEWKAWAFPQSLSTGMTTREIDNDETKEQRKQFSDADGWFYYGTVHHHCSSAAFQSGTDSANEEDQDGIHITVGKINSEQYDIDARVYQSGYKLVDFNLLDFWDTGDVYEGISAHVKGMLPKDYVSRMALLQMGTPAPKDYAFPEVWKTNLIVPPRAVSVPVTNYGGSEWNQGSFYGRRMWTKRSYLRTEFDDRRFVQDMIEYLSSTESRDITCAQVIELYQTLEKSLTLQDIDLFDIMVRNDVRFEAAIELINRLQQKLVEEELQRELDGEKSNGKSKKQIKKEKRQQQQLGMPPAHHHVRMNDDHSWETDGGTSGGYPGYGSGYGIGG